jgi:DNA-binding response OmpR family regulator
MSKPSPDRTVRTWGFLEEADPEPKITLPAPTILVVDDDPVSRLVAVHALARMRFETRIRQASTGEEALAMIRRERPDLVVLDVAMPDMDGFEVCRRLRADFQTAFTPVLMLTGNTDEASRSQAFLMGTDDYMTKPLSVPELHSRARRLLNRNYDC